LHPSYQLVCTGHSLGANVAAVLTLLLRQGEDQESEFKKRGYAPHCEEIPSPRESAAEGKRQELAAGVADEDAQENGASNGFVSPREAAADGKRQELAAEVADEDARGMGLVMIV